MKAYESLKSVRKLFFEGKITREELSEHVEALVKETEEDKLSHVVTIKVSEDYVIRGTCLAVDVARALEAVDIHADIYQCGQKIISLKR